ncbi:hypothetical protein AAG906_009812 [Vitis piasezkii]
MTITLQDVAIILGLRIHGSPIIDTCDIDWSLLCYELFSVTSSTYEIKRSAISTRWLCHQFSHPLIDSDNATLERLHVGRPDFGQPPAPPAAQHLDHDAIDDLPAEGPIGVHHRLLDKDQGLQDKALLDKGLPADPLGCSFMGTLHGRFSCPSSSHISSRLGDLADDFTSDLL